MQFKVVDDARRAERKDDVQSPFRLAIRKGQTVLVEKDGRKMESIRRNAIANLRALTKEGYKVHTHSAKDGLIVWADPPEA